jgi:hypothetical protein
VRAGAIVRARRASRVGGRRLKLTVRRLAVPRYEVTVQGRGIAVPVEGSLAVGFLRLIQVTARDPVEARERAIERARSEWHSGAHASANRSGMLYLTIDTIGLLSWWHRFLGAPKGYIFFSEDGVQTPSNDALERP